MRGYFIAVAVVVAADSIFSNMKHHHCVYESRQTPYYEWMLSTVAGAVAVAVWERFLLPPHGMAPRYAPWQYLVYVGLAALHP